MLTKFVADLEKRHSDHDAEIQETRTMLRNQQASIHNIETQLGQLAQQINQRRPIELPSKTENNLRMENVNAIATSFGEIFTPLNPAQKVSTKEHAEKTEDSSSAKPVTTRRFPLMDSTSPRSEDKTVVSLMPYRLPLPYLIRAIPDEKDKA